jgi:anthraniloyl-CoA monooxygenase
VPSEQQLASLTRAAEAGAGLVITEPVAVSPTARITPGSAGCWDDRQAEAWGAVAARVQRAGSRQALRLSHAGRRGSCAPRDRGVDRSLRDGGWPSVAASSIPYAPWLPAPAELDAGQMASVAQDFAAAAARAAEAGADLVFLDWSDGYLLAGFLSPLSNRRSDRYGGSLDNRLRFPMEVLQAVRAAWPSERPLGVRLVAEDRQRDGLTVDEATEIARGLADAGVALIDVTAGLTTGSDAAAGEYRRLYQVGLADRLRNSGGIATIASGRITTLDEIDTVVAAGRADLCVLDPRLYR